MAAPIPTNLSNESNAGGLAGLTRFTSSGLRINGDDIDNTMLAIAAAAAFVSVWIFLKKA